MKNIGPIRIRARRATGAILFLLLLFAALAGPAIAPYEINEADDARYIVNEGGDRVWLAPPFPPSRAHLLGTDRWGYDTLTRMLHGAKYTLGFVVGVALIRVALAFCVASVSHLWSHSRKRWQPREITRPSLGTAVPEFVVAYIALAGIAFNPPASVVGFALIQAVLLSIIGLPGLVPTLRARMERAAREPFVEAQISLGANGWHVYRHTVVPALTSDLWLLLSHESLLVALVTGELALFSIFVGGTMRTFDPVEYYSRSHEWVGLVGENSGEILGGVYRLILVPLAGYLLVLLALALLSETSHSASPRHKQQ